MKEFLIEAPKMVRYLCTGLVIHSLKVAGIKDCDKIINVLLFCLTKKGMTPCVKILSYLSQFSSSREKLI